MKKILCGNEAISQGAYESGIIVATSYPGTPASEIMNYFLSKKSKDFYSEWSNNEKVALEICIGVSTMKQRSSCSMKANGFNLCIDTLMSLTKKGITGGLVIVVVDDPESRYSDVIQDTSKFMEIIGFPILRPTTVLECYNLTKEAFELSEKKKVPVFLSFTNKLGHLYSPIEISDKRIEIKKPEFDRTQYKFNPYSKEKEKIIPYFCNGCPHESFYSYLELPKDYVINGDIGCYEIAGFGNNKENKKQLRDIIHTLFVMGSGINVSQGQLLCGQKSIAMCGDSTFWHSGITGLINAVYNRHNVTFIIMDNGCVGMTGQNPVPEIPIEKVCEALGCNVEIINPYKKEEVSSAIGNAIKNPDRINVIISRSLCMLKKIRDIKTKSVLK